jgi:hypothetical protein
MKPVKAAITLEALPSSIIEGKLYYAVTFLGTAEGVVSSVFSGFCGFTDTTPRLELRCASAVKPERLLEFWQEAGQSYVVVNEAAHFYIFYMLGGHALIESVLADAWMPELVGPKPVVMTGASGSGFTTVKALPPHSFRRAPTPKHRMRILNRDGFRCRICGRRPENNTDIELDVHHIRPWGKGGISTDGNLITLCHTCHSGLDPHDSPDLFKLLDGNTSNESVEESTKEYWKGVHLYRRLLADTLDAVGEEGATKVRAQRRR